MTQQPEMEALRTWSHLSGQRKRPTEYEVVSTNLLWSMRDPHAPWELGRAVPMSKWYLTYRNGSPLRHADWNAFRDPDRLVYRTYTMMQDGQENYVDGLLDDHDKNHHDAKLAPEWLKILARAYTPGRYLIHALQMGSAYLVQLAHSSTIENCAMFQAADQLRWVSRIAYRTRELANRYPDLGFARTERQTWEQDPAWQGFRELMERVLATYDWGEHFVALQLVAKPAVDEVFLKRLGAAARRADDSLLGMLTDAQLLDSDRSKRWTKALLEFVLDTDGNRELIRRWVRKWEAPARKAMREYCGALPEAKDAYEEALEGMAEFRGQIGLDRVL